MSFQIDCPDCGRRPVWEFHYGGPLQSRPLPTDDAAIWTDYNYNKPNIRGVQVEWWFHHSACKEWFIAERDTRANKVLATRRFTPEQSSGTGEAGGV